MRYDKIIIRVIAGLLLGFYLSVSHAQSPLTWEQLADNEQKVLKKYQHHWQNMSPEQQQTLQKVAQRWQNMNKVERAAMQQRMARWQHMPDENKQQIREGYRQFKQLSPEQQQLLTERMKRFRELPQQEREALQQSWQQTQSQLKQPVDEAVPGSNKDEGIDRSSESADGQTKSRLNSSGRLQNKRIDRQRIDRPMRRPR